MLLFRYLPLASSWLIVGLSTVVSIAGPPCRVEIVDEQNGWPVPLVELATTHQVRFVSDNAGVIAFDLPELMNVPTWFHVHGHGYEVAADGFGYRGVRITPRPGEKIQLKVKRRLPAKRLGRITGAGLFAESQKLGQFGDQKESRIMGCDSVQTAMFGDRLFWLWGDTTLAHYPLGRFHMIGATTSFSPLSSFVPPVRLSYDYFTDDQNVPRNVAEMGGEGPTWLSGLTSVPDSSGQDHLVATYSKIKPPLTETKRGLCQWNETEGRFESIRLIWEKSAEQPESPPTPHGHAIGWTDSDNQSWILFGDPFPTLGCPATLEDWSTPERWKVFTPQTEVSTQSRQRGQSGQGIVPHRGCVVWNDFRKRWLTVFTQYGGNSSFLGELWYAESESPFGPWENAVHIVTHDNMTFYNPKLHPELVPKGSPILLIEATYTQTFAKAPNPTPRYDYNQILYRLDLDELTQGNRF